MARKLLKQQQKNVKAKPTLTKSSIIFGCLFYEIYQQKPNHSIVDHEVNSSVHCLPLRDIIQYIDFSDLRLLCFATKAKMK